MVSKVSERIYAESAARLLGVSWRFVEIPEPLDFEVQSEREAFGLEVRQVFADKECAFGSPTRRIEAQNQNHIRDIASQYYRSAGPPIAAKFLGPVTDVEIDLVVERMMIEAPASPFARHTIYAGDHLKVFLTALPKEFGNYSQWVCVNDRVGWVGETTQDDLQHAVDRKTANLPLYLAKYPIIDLLLVADRTVNSGRIRATTTLSVQNPGFRAVYFLSYPEYAVRVG